MLFIPPSLISALVMESRVVETGLGGRPSTFLNSARERHTTGHGALRRSMRGKGMFGWLCIAIVVIFIILMKSHDQTISSSKVQRELLSNKATVNNAGYWRRSSYPRFDWPSLPEESNGYLLVRCYGDLHQHRAAISDAVLVARIMNATLVLPELDVNSFWHNDSGFQGLYNVEHFNFSLRNYVRIVKSIPKTEKIKPYQLQPPKDAPISWYEQIALGKMKEHGAIYLTPFLHSLTEEIDDPEYQRLRCEVNYHAVIFKEDIRRASISMYEALVHRQGYLIAIDLRSGMDIVPVAGCLDTFSPNEQRTVKKYSKENYTEQKDERATGNCPITPEQIGLIIRALGFDNSTVIYLIGGEHFSDERFMKPLCSMFTRVGNRRTVDPQGLAGLALDYMISLMSEVYIPIYDGSSRFFNTLLGHRMYFHGMPLGKERDPGESGSSLQPDKKALARILIDWDEGQRAGFEEAVRRVMLNESYNGREKSFYMKPWPECFCQVLSQNRGDNCSWPHIETRDLIPMDSTYWS